MTELDYQILTKEYVKHLNTIKQLEFLTAYRRCKLDGRSWRWIYTALTHKSIDNWVEYGFGLLFTKNYIDYINWQIELEDSDNTLTLKKFFEIEAV